MGAGMFLGLEKLKKKRSSKDIKKKIQNRFNDNNNKEKEGLDLDDINKNKRTK